MFDDVLPLWVDDVYHVFDDVYMLSDDVYHLLTIVYQFVLRGFQLCDDV
jgi:hypothetical protein